MTRPIHAPVTPLDIQDPLEQNISSLFADDLTKSIKQTLASGAIAHDEINKVIIHSVISCLDRKYNIKDRELAQKMVAKSLQDTNVANEIFTITDRQEIDNDTSLRLAQHITNNLNKQSDTHTVISPNTLQGMTDRVNINIRTRISDATRHKGQNTHWGSLTNTVEIGSTMGLTTNGLANMLQSTGKGIAGSAGIGGINAIINTHLGRSIMRGMEKSQAPGFLGRLKGGVASPTSGSLLALWLSAILATGYIDRAASIGAIGITAAANAEVNKRLTKQNGMNDAISSAQNQLPRETEIEDLKVKLEQFIKSEEPSGKSASYNFKYKVINGEFSTLAEAISKYNPTKKTVYDKLKGTTYPAFVTQLKTIATESGLSQSDQIFIQDPNKSYINKIIYLQNLATKTHTDLKNAAKMLTENTSVVDKNGNFKTIHTNFILANDVGLAFASPTQGEEALQNIANKFEETQRITNNIKQTTDKLAKAYNDTLQSIHTVATDNYVNVNYNIPPDLSYQVKVPDYTSAVALAKQHIKIDLDNDASMKIIKESFGEKNLKKIEQFCLLRGWGIAFGLGLLSLLGMTWSISQQRKNSEETRKGLKSYETLIETIIDSVHMHLNDDLDAIFKSRKEGSQVVPRAHVSNAVWSWIVSTNPDMRQYAPAAYVSKSSEDEGKLQKIKTFIWQGLIGDTRTEKQIKLNELIETFKKTNIANEGKIDGENLDQILAQLGINIDDNTSPISIQNLAQSIATSQDTLEKEVDKIKNGNSSRGNKIEIDEKNILQEDENAHSPEHQKKRMLKALFNKIQTFDQTFSTDIGQTLSDEGIASKIRSFREEILTYMNNRKEEIENQQQGVGEDRTIENKSTQTKGVLRKTLTSIASFFSSPFQKKSEIKKSKPTIQNIATEPLKIPEIPVIHTSSNSAYVSFQNGHETFSQMIHHLPVTKDRLIELIGNDKKSKSLSDNVWSLAEDIRELDALHSKARAAIEASSKGIQDAYTGDTHDLSGHFNFIIEKLGVILPAQRSLKAYQKKKHELENVQTDPSKKYILDALEKVNTNLSQKRQDELHNIDPEYTDIASLSRLSMDEFDAIKLQIAQGKIEREKIQQNNLFIQDLLLNGLINESEQIGMSQYFLDKTEEERVQAIRSLGIRKDRRDRIAHEGIQEYISSETVTEISEEAFETMVKEAQERKYKKETICDPLRNELLEDGVQLDATDEVSILTAENLEDTIRIKHAIKVKYAKIHAINQLTSEGFTDVTIIENESDAEVILDTFYQQYITDQLALVDIFGSEIEEKVGNRDQAEKCLIGIFADVLKKEAPSYILNESTTSESIIQVILRQRIIRENNKLIAKIDEFMEQEGIKEGKESGASLNIRREFVHEVINQENPKKINENDVHEVIKAMRQAHQIQKQQLTDRLQKVNDEIGDQKEILDGGIFESLLSLRNTDQDVDKNLERISNLALLLNKSELKIKKWMLSIPEDQYSNLCKILEKTANNLKQADIIKHVISLEDASKFEEIAMNRYIDLIKEGDHITLGNKAILTLIHAKDGVEYTLGISEILG